MGFGGWTLGELRQGQKSRQRASLEGPIQRRLSRDSERKSIPPYPTVLTMPCNAPLNDNVAETEIAMRQVLLLAALMIGGEWPAKANTQSPRAIGPSFDCQRAPEALSRIICGDAGLRRRDLELAHA